MGQFLAAAGLALLVAFTGRESGIAPMMVFNWHGYRAGLDPEGTGGPPAGLDDLRAAGISHVGVPQDHTGDFGHRDYIANIEAMGIRIVRTMERRWNAGLFTRDLGGIILSWQSVAEPGEFFHAYAENLQAPCHGIAWNLEHDILNREKYPITKADRELADIWLVDLSSETEYVAFRGRQFALIFQMYFAVAKRLHSECALAIGYSGYSGLQSRGLPVAAAYGVDWKRLGEAQQWRGHRFAPITHAMGAWHTTVELPDEARTPQHQLAIIHTIALAPSLRSDENFRRQLNDRLALLREEDGIGTVEHGIGSVWDAEDERVHRLMGETLVPVSMASDESRDAGNE